MVHAPMALSYESNGGSVLIIESDDSLRTMISTILRLSGFTTVSVAPGDVTAALLRGNFDAIVRDVNLAPVHRERTLQELRRVDRDILMRTVLTTAEPPALLGKAAIPEPFAVIHKPFDVEVLVNTVRDCRDRGRRDDATSATETKHESREADPPAKMNLAAICRFVRTVPGVRALLTHEAESVQELLLRGELRRTAMEIAHALLEASTNEPNSRRASILRDTARVAEELGIPRGPMLSAVAHEH